MLFKLISYRYIILKTGTRISLLKYSDNIIIILKLQKTNKHRKGPVTATLDKITYKKFK